MAYGLYSTLNPIRGPKPIVNYHTNVNFSDIYGMEDIKQQMEEIIDYLRDSTKYEKIGARMRRGVLLFGPSGTGKTLMAKAVAGEAKANFIYRSASEFVEKYVGVGAERIRELFTLAEELKPTIIFIDEIDALGARVKSRSSFNSSHIADINNTINQLLTELDGFKERSNIVVIAATNNHMAMDPSLIRAGRFDLKIKTRLPNEDERKGIFKKKLERTKQTVKDETLDILCERTIGYSGADIECVVNEAAYIALRKSMAIIDDSCIFEAADYFHKSSFAVQDNNYITE